MNTTDDFINWCRADIGTQPILEFDQWFESEYHMLPPEAINMAFKEVALKAWFAGSGIKIKLKIYWRDWYES
jgi:hypothetical protein